MRILVNTDIRRAPFFHYFGYPEFRMRNAFISTAEAKLR